MGKVNIPEKQLPEASRWNASSWYQLDRTSLCLSVLQGITSPAIAGPGSALQVARDFTRSQPRGGRALGPGVTFSPRRVSFPCIDPKREGRSNLGVWGSQAGGHGQGRCR